MDFAVKARVEKVILASSGSIYGRAPVPHHEIDSIPQPVNLYGKSKLICEELTRMYKVPAVVLRIFAGYGPGEGVKGRLSSVVTQFMDRIRRNEPPLIYGDGLQSRDFIYVDDVIKAVMRSAELGESDVINVGSGISYTFNDVVRILCDLTGNSVAPQYVGKPSSYLETTLADTTRLRNLLKLNPLTLEQGLQAYLDFIDSGSPH
jgi:nucleoside-diphosphate-sugar epimerase